MNEDTWLLIALWAMVLAMFAGLIFRTRRCGVIVLPFLIAGLFLALPKAWWWIPVVLGVVWLTFLFTIRLRGIALPEPKIPVMVRLAASYIICPLLVREKILCSGKRMSCYKRASGRKKVNLLYVRFEDDPAEYRVSWLFYRRMSRAGLGKFTYEKCISPMGVCWIRDVRG